MTSERERLRSLLGSAAYSDRDWTEADVQEVDPDYRRAVLAKANKVRALWAAGNTADAMEVVNGVTEEEVRFAEGEASTDPRALADHALGKAPDPADVENDPRTLARDITIW